MLRLFTIIWQNYRSDCLLSEGKRDFSIDEMANNTNLLHSDELIRVEFANKSEPRCC
jgi:hypothetical protein